MIFDKKQRFSIRKYSIGVCSVLLGMTLLQGAVLAEEAPSSSSQVRSSQLVDAGLEVEVGREQTAEANPDLDQVSKNSTVSEAEVSPLEVSAGQTEAQKAAPAVQDSQQENKEGVAQGEETKLQSSTSSVNAIETPAHLEKKEDTPILTQVEDTPRVSEENQLIHLQPLWDRNIKGQGRVIAVLDTGLDPLHDVFRLTDPSLAKYKNQADIEKVKQKAGITYGKWYNEKIVFAYNYSDMDDIIKEDDPRSHGTHVAGTALANARTPAPTGDKLLGVAPEAQLLFMRIFSDKKGGTEQNFIVAKAVEDAISLGADTINMSFGVLSGALNDVDGVTRQAFEKARKAGVLISAAAGNYAVNGYWHNYPKASTPDTGVVDSPSVEEDILSIAAYNNSIQHKTEIQIKVPQLANQEEFHQGNIKNQLYRLSFSKEGLQSYRYITATDEEAYKQLNLNGEIALVESGGPLSNESKINLLRQAGASAVLVFQNAEEGDELVGLSLGYWGSTFPVAVMGHKDGKELASHSDRYQLEIQNKVTKIPSTNAGKMLYFTGWGLSADGKLKPDVTLPGGMIYSAINDNNYDMDSGTSMATPHATGLVTLLKQVLEKRFPDLTPEQLHQRIRQLLMSTAKPIFDEESQSYASVRQQGAGLADAAAAAFGEIVVKNQDGISSLTLGNVGDVFDIELTLQNLSDSEKTLNYHTIVNSDQIAEGRFTLQMQQLDNLKGTETLKLAAHAEKTIRIRVDTSQHSQKLTQEMPNGYFLEGYVFFTDAKTGQQLASIPYIGFKGSYQNLPAIEKPIYDFTGDEKPFYYYENDFAEKPKRDEGNHFTALISTVDGKEQVLGKQNKGYDGENLFFSPNGDGAYDYVEAKAVILRNLENLQLRIYAKDDRERQHPLYKAGNEREKKTDYGWNINDKSRKLYASYWDGKDQEGQLLPDGIYQYVLTYRPSTPGADPQQLIFQVRLDSQAPSLLTSSPTYDAQRRRFRPSEILEEGSGLAGRYLSYQKNGEEVEIVADDNGGYQIPEEADLSTVRFYLWDKARNVSIWDLEGRQVAQETPSQEQSSTANTVEADLKEGYGSIEVRFLDRSGNVNSQYPEIARYLVYDEAGRRVDEEFNAYYTSKLPQLPYGVYEFELVSHDSAYDFLTPKKIRVKLDKTQPRQQIDFVYDYKESNALSLLFSEPVPAGTKVYASKQGQRVELRPTLYNPLVFERMLENGVYQIEIELPIGYASTESIFEYQVDGKLNRHWVHFYKLSQSSQTATENKQTSDESKFKQEQKKQEFRTVWQGDQTVAKAEQAINSAPNRLREKGDKIVSSISKKTEPKVEKLPETGDVNTSLGGFAALLLSGMTVLHLIKRKKD